MIKRQGLFDGNIVNKVVTNYLEFGDKGLGENYSWLIWAYFVFQQWYEYYIKGASR
jgi:asparagine synthase (glutamine-hydrolysing)